MVLHFLRCHLLDRSVDTPSVEELALQDNRGLIAVACVSFLTLFEPRRDESNGAVLSCSVNRWLWGLSGPFLGVYVIVQNLNIPLILQPHFFATLCFVSWAQVGSNSSRCAWGIAHSATPRPVSILRQEVLQSEGSRIVSSNDDSSCWFRSRNDLCNHSGCFIRRCARPQLCKATHYSSPSFPAAGLQCRSYCAC